MFPTADEKIISFEQDAFDLERVADNLTSLIRNQEEPLVISLSSPWGTGKTTFLKMWQNKLKEKEDCICIYFNAWENDYVEDPLMAFFGELDGLVDKMEEESKLVDSMKEGVSNLWANRRLLRKELVPIIISTISQGLLSGELVKEVGNAWGDSKNIYEKMVEKAISSQKSIKGQQKKFREILSNFASEIRKASNNFPLVVLVDELDRCRPDFALTFIERIKHFMEVPNIVFILSMDRGALEAAVECRYGAGIGKEGYLNRFFDLSYSLPPADPIQYAENLFSQFNITNITSRWSVQNSPFEGLTWNDLLMLSFAVLSRNFNLSLREQNRAISFVLIVMNGISTGVDDSSYGMGSNVCLTYMLLRFLPTFLYVAAQNAYTSLKENKKYDWESIAPNPSEYEKPEIRYIEMLMKECLSAIRDRLLLKDRESFAEKVYALRNKDIGRGHDSTRHLFSINFRQALLDDRKNLIDIFNHIEFIGSLMPSKEPDHPA